MSIYKQTKMTANAPRTHLVQVGVVIFILSLLKQLGALTVSIIHRIIALFGVHGI